VTASGQGGGPATILRPRQRRGRARPLGGWRANLSYDPLPPLLAANDLALAWNVRHDLLDASERPESLWELRDATRILHGQRGDGSWPAPHRNEDLRTLAGARQLATYHALLPLVMKYRFDGGHPAIRRAAEFLLDSQASEGDIRGIYGRQYSPTYSAAILAVLVEAGLGGDPRIDRCYAWLADIRQDDGGWAIPLRTRGYTFHQAALLDEPLSPDRGKPFSHLVTGMVLRALVADPDRRSEPMTRQAAGLLASRLLRADVYPDRRDPEYWAKLAFPFHWTDAVAALDAIALAGLPAEVPEIRQALSWLAELQQPDGSWPIGYPTPRDRELRRAWASFAAARVFRRFYEVTR
jgi:hypothetical protein